MQARINENWDDWSESLLESTKRKGESPMYIDLNKKVSIKELRGILQLTQEGLAKLASVDVGVVKRAESLKKSVQYLTAVRLVNALDKELHTKELLPKDTKLSLNEVEMLVK